MSKNNTTKPLSIVPGSKQDYHQAFFDIQISEDKLLTKKELAEFLCVSIKMIDRKVHMNEIPFFKVGRLVRFSKASILSWAANRAS